MCGTTLLQPPRRYFNWHRKTASARISRTVAEPRTGEPLPAATAALVVNWHEGASASFICSLTGRGLASHGEVVRHDPAATAALVVKLAQKRRKRRNQLGS